MTKRVIFLYNDKIIGHSADVDLDSIERMKKVVAFEQEIPDIDDITYTVEDVPANQDASDFEVSPQGLRFKMDAEDSIVDGINLMMNPERDLDRFLDRVKKGTLHEVIQFTYIYLDN